MKNKKLAILGVIFALALAVRTVNFSELMTFGPEQAMSLLVSADYLIKPSLLGQPYWRYTESGHQLFNSPLFNYSLLPLMWMFKFDPVPITLYFSFLNWITGILIYVLFHKLVGHRVALIAAILFLFNNFMIFHSRFIWIVHYTPLLGLVSTYWLYKYRFKLEPWVMFALGVLAGIGWGLDYTYAFYAAPALLLALFFSRRKLLALVLLGSGFVLGDGPRMIFDLRHNFYTLTELLKYTWETFNRPEQGGLVYYHFFPYWPVLALILAWIVNRSRWLVAVVLTAYLLFNLSSEITWGTYPIGIKDQKQATTIIAADQPANFNVVSLLDFDTRGHILRYLLRYPHDLTPQPVDQYSQVDTVYALAPVSYDLNQPANYELKSFWPYQITIRQVLSDRFILYKLIK